MPEQVLDTPLTDKDIAKLKAGDRVKINGRLYTARDAAHKKLVELIEKGERLPIDISGQIIFYAGPAPAKPGYVIGPVGPTTSGRMDNYTVPLLAKGLKGMIGKGTRSEEVKQNLIRYGAVYFAAVGGTAALSSRKVKKAKVVAYPELGPEAVFELEVAEFPVVVVNDIYGNDLYQEGIKRYRDERENTDDIT